MTQLPADDGDNKARFSGESAKQAVKPLRRECRSASAEPVCSCALSLPVLHARPRVQRASGIPCSLVFEGQRNAKLGQNRAARMRTRICCLKIESKCHHVIASAAKQSILSLRGNMDCFASPRDDGFDRPAAWL